MDTVSDFVRNSINAVMWKCVHDSIHISIHNFVYHSIRNVVGNSTRNPVSVIDYKNRGWEGLRDYIRNADNRELRNS